MSDIFFFTMSANIRDGLRPDGDMCVELDGRPQFFDHFGDALLAAERQFYEDKPDVVIVYCGGWDCQSTAVSAVSRSSGGEASPATRHNMPILRTDRDANDILVREFDTTIYSGV